MRKASAELAKMMKVLLSLSQDDREKALSALSLRERQVLAMRLGLSGSPDVFELAKKLGISKNRIVEMGIKTEAMLECGDMKKGKNRCRAKRSICGDVTFLPVVGDKFVSCGRRLLGRKVLIVGASHYCKAHFNHANGCSKCCKGFGKYHFRCGGRDLYFGKQCEKFTQVVYERYRERLGNKEDCYWFRTFSRFYNSFFWEGSPSHAERVRLLDHIACTEYMQGVEGDGPTARNDAAMADERNFMELEKLIKQLKPDVVVFWGPRAWNVVCRRSGITDSMPDVQCATIGSRRVTLIRTPHPSAFGKNGFHREDFRKQLKRAGVNLIECSES